MVELPWWPLSPSPMTIGYWIALALWGARKIGWTSPRSSLRKNASITLVLGWLKSFVFAVWILAIPVLTYDVVWCIFQGMRFIVITPFFLQLVPSDPLQLVYSAGRSLSGTVFSLFIVQEFFYKGTVSFNVNFKKAYLLLLIYTCVWFGLAPDPSWTDWTFAWRFGYDQARIIEAFLISHVGSKALQALVYYEMWVKH